jgi:hypothetical protein
MKCKIVFRFCALFVCSLFALGSVRAQTVYVLTESWEVIVVDMQKLEYSDRFEIVQSPPPLIEERVEMNFGEYVPGKNLLFVSNKEGGVGDIPGLKIMKVDLKTKISTVFFRDQPDVPGSGTLMPDAGDYYYDVQDDLLYAHYYDIVYVLDKNGNIKNTFQDVPWLALSRKYPRFGKKVYKKGAGSLIEFDLTTCTEKKVLTDLPWIGGDPFASGAMKFLSQTSEEAEILIADRKTKLLHVNKSDPTGADQWTIRREESWAYVVNEEKLVDIPGYKRFDGELLTVTPRQGDLTFWAFEPTGPDMQLIYRVTLPSAEDIWKDVEENPRDSNTVPWLNLFRERTSLLHNTQVTHLTASGWWSSMRLQVTS